MITVDAEQIKRAELLLGHIPGGTNKAIVSAINRAAESARTAAAKKAREEYVIQSGRVKEVIGTTRATIEHLSAAVYTKGRPRALSYFKVRPSKSPAKRPKKLLYAQVRRDGGGTIKGAFVAVMKSGHVGVFHRTDTERYPIKQNYGPSIAQMLSSQTVSAFVEERAQEQLKKRLDHEIDRMLRGIGK